jgi:hypothetical protein
MVLTLLAMLITDATLGSLRRDATFSFQQPLLVGADRNRQQGDDEWVDIVPSTSGRGTPSFGKA